MASDRYRMPTFGPSHGTSFQQDLFSSEARRLAQSDRLIKLARIQAESPPDDDIGVMMDGNTYCISVPPPPGRLTRDQVGRPPLRGGSNTTFFIVLLLSFASIFTFFLYLIFAYIL